MPKAKSRTHSFRLVNGTPTAHIQRKDCRHSKRKALVQVNNPGGALIWTSAEHTRALRPQ